MILTTNFDSGEFQAASDTTLTATQLAKARQFAVTLLQPLRDAMGFPITITSFVRSGSDAHAASRPHANGDAVDFVPTSRDRADYAAMQDWLATNLRDRYGELLEEITPYHLHMTLPGFAGDHGQTLVENPDKPDTFLEWIGQKVEDVKTSVADAAQTATDYLTNPDNTPGTVAALLAVLGGLLFLQARD